MDKEKLLFLAVSAALLLFSVRLLPKRALPVEPVTVAVASDLHYIAPSLTDNGSGFQYLIENGDGKDMLHCEEIVNAFLYSVMDAKPAALLLTGDLTFNGARASHTALAQKLRAVQDAGVRVLVLPGNHDLNSKIAASFSGDTYELVEGVDEAAFMEIYAPFGYAAALSRDAASLSYTAAISDQLWALMIDVNGVERPGTLPEETILWARRQLEEARRQGVRVIAASHQTLLQHNSLFTEGFIAENTKDLVTVFQQYGVICSFCGHMHIQHIAEADTFPEIASSALVTWPCQYGLLSLDGNNAHYYTVPVEASQEVTQSAYWLLWNTAYRQAGAELTSGATVASGVDGLCSFFAGVNVRYVAGLGDTIHWDDAAIREWQERGAGRAAYLESIRADGGRNFTEHRFVFR
ncbi:MAG: metallophosphoesterase [Oscillibacter sp.]|nr:metallophosphoesterase [Oscillibacter sp.]